MTRRFVITLGSSLIVIALVLSACNGGTSQPTEPGKTVTGTVTSPTTTTAAPKTTAIAPTVNASVTPTYGGTFTFVFAHQKATDYFDPVISAIGGHILGPTYDRLVEADWAKGPAGTNEFAFDISNTPAKYRTGTLLESWEMLDMNTMIWHIRKGVRFQNKYPGNGKELTAADIVAYYQRGLKDPRWTGYGAWEWTDTAGVQGRHDVAIKNGRTEAEWSSWVSELKSVNWPFFAGGYTIAQDKYTVKYRIFTPSSAILDVTSWMFIPPSESVGVDLSDWKNACGTGPFIVQDCVPASSTTWKRNPNYWMEDPVHKGNMLPYIETLRGLIIIEEATALAALRTHKVDVLGVAWDKVDGLKKSNPDLQWRKILPTGASVIFMRTDLAPFSDVRVRQALSMGVDRATIINDYFKGNAIPDAWPISPGNADSFTPIDKMPADVKQLFDYNPDLAKKLLADAGFPTGFKSEVAIYISPVDQDVLQLVKEQWAKINVNIDIKVLEGATHSSMIYGMTYPAMIYSYWGNASPQSVMGWAHGGVPTSIYAFSKVVDPEAEKFYQAWAKEANPDKASAMLKQEYLRENKLVWEIPLPTSVGNTTWQQYVRGFRGEVNMGLTSEMGNTSKYKFFWIDQALKLKIAGEQ